MLTNHTKPTTEYTSERLESQLITFIELSASEHFKGNYSQDIHSFHKKLATQLTAELPSKTQLKSLEQSEHIIQFVIGYTV